MRLVKENNQVEHAPFISVRARSGAGARAGDD